MSTEDIPSSNQPPSDRRPAGPPLWTGFNLRMQPTAATPYTYQGSPYTDSPSELLGEKTRSRVVGQYGLSVVGDRALLQDTRPNGKLQSGDQSTMDERLLLHPDLLIPKYSKITKYRWACFRMASFKNISGNSDQICYSTAHYPLHYCPGDSRGDIPGCDPKHLGCVLRHDTHAETMEGAKP